MRTKEEYENLINSSRLFTIDKEKDSILYKTEWRHFTVLLVEYYSNYVFTGKTLDSYSMELMETSVECVKYYDVTKGMPFLHYFSVSLKKTLLKAKAKKEADTMRCGISVSEADGRLIRKILKYAQVQGKDVHDDGFQIKVAKLLDISVAKVKDLIDINTNSVVVHETHENEDGDEITIFDTISSDELNPEEKLQQKDDVEQLLKSILRVYNKLQERTKPIIRKLLTIYLIKVIDDPNSFENYCCHLEYIDKTIENVYLQGGVVPSAKEISAEFGVHEASASRTFNKFLEKDREKVKRIICYTYIKV